MPWLSKYKLQSKHITKLLVLPTKPFEGAGGRPWVYRDSFNIPAEVLNAGLKTYLTNRCTIDIAFARLMELRQIPEIYSQLAEADINVRQGAVEVPIITTPNGDFDEEVGDIDIIWTAKPQDTIMKLWDQAMEALDAATKQIEDEKAEKLKAKEEKADMAESQAGAEETQDES